jgi:hypothetical protein
MREDHSRNYNGVGDADYNDFDSIPFSPTSQASPAVQSNPVHRRFPSPEDCDKAFVHVVPGDGNCLFASLLEAAYSIGGVISEPGVSVSSLRLTVMRYIEDNRNHDVLPVISLDDEASALVSPESHLRGQMPGRLVQTADSSLVPCSSCLADASNKSKQHCCGGIPFGEIIIMGSNTPSYYTSFETYIRLMSQDKAFGEDLEIMAFSSCFKVSVSVCHFASEHLNDENKWQIHTFDNPQSRATIVLLNSDGRGHYDWLSFPTTLPAVQPNGCRLGNQDVAQNSQQFPVYDSFLFDATEKLECEHLLRTASQQQPSVSSFSQTKSTLSIEPAAIEVTGSPCPIVQKDLQIHGHQSQFPPLFDSQIQSLETIQQAADVACSQKRLATVAIVTPTSTGKDLLPFLWAVQQTGVSILFVPYVHLLDEAFAYAAKYICSVETLADTKQTNNSAATCVVCSYEVADKVLYFVVYLFVTHSLAGRPSRANISFTKTPGRYFSQ